MIWYDVTKMGGKAARSGLTRLSARLRRELGAAVTEVTWQARRRAWTNAGTGEVVRPAATDWLLTVELFSDDERPGFAAWLQARTCRLAAVFHDAIPLRHPHITWPRSVQRHPEYMRLLAGFDLVLADSVASARDLEAFWAWQRVAPRARVQPMVLGADFDGAPRVTGPVAAAAGRPSLLCVGIVEPRKNQALLLDAAERLWGGGVDFDLNVVGRVNPHFGGPVEQRMRALQRCEPRFRYHAAAADAALAALYASARAVAFPTLAEGCGLPVLEALWRGVPCVCSDLPVIRENADGGGCLALPVNDLGAWETGLKRILVDDALWRELAAAARTRPLPRWSDTAATILSALDVFVFTKGNEGNEGRD